MLDGKTITPRDANGKLVEPFAVDGTTYLPIRAVASALGLDMEWKQATKTVKLTSGAEPAASAPSTQPPKIGVETITAVYTGTKIVLNGGLITPKDSNGKTVEPFAVSGTTYLPIRAVASALGLDVEWEQATKTIRLFDTPALPTPSPEPATPAPTPTAPPSGVFPLSMKKPMTIVAGPKQTLGIRSDGTVLAAGLNEGGGLNVGGWTDIVALCSTRNQTLAVKSDGTVIGTGTYYDTWEPVLSALRDVVDIVESGDLLNGFIATLHSDGTVTFIDKYGQSQKLDWTNIVQISAGKGFLIGLRSDGTAVAYGMDYFSTKDVWTWKTGRASPS